MLKKNETLNVWNLGNRRPTREVGPIQNVKNNFTWAYQRTTKGYCQRDIWSIYTHLEKLIPSMLEELKDTKVGYPSMPGMTEEKWDNILEQMIFLFKEANDETCTKVNPYEEEHTKALEEFEKRYGLLGEKLRTEDEKKDDEKYGMVHAHFMSELSEYAEIDKKWTEAEDDLTKYQSQCKDEALDMLKKYWYDLWN